MRTGALGEFVLARREAVRPQDVGLPEHGVRRVAGLRREEVAVVASVSVDYYARLEQGRERHPSAEVLDALARAFDLDDDAREHLFRLAELIPRPSRSVRKDVSPDLLRLMDRWSDVPALVIDRTLDILAANPLARALFAEFAEPDNLVRMAFLDPVGRRFYLEWDRVAQTTVATLRVAAGVDPTDPRLEQLLTELEAASPEFRSLWRRQHVRGKTREAKRFHHHEVGDLHLAYQAFDVRSSPGQELIVYQAEPGSASAQNLSLLATLAATEAEEQRSAGHRGS